MFKMRFSRSFFTFGSLPCPQSCFSKKQRYSVNKHMRGPQGSWENKGPSKQDQTRVRKTKTVSNKESKSKQNVGISGEAEALPKYFWKPKSNFDIRYSFTTDPHIAELIATLVMKSVKEDETVIELNPGKGLITQSLLKKGLKNLTVYDNMSFKGFKEICNNYGDRIKLLKQNILQASEPTDPVYLKELDKLKGEHVTIIGINPSRVFFRRILQTIILYEWSFCQNVEFYFAISEQIYDCLTGSHSHQSRAYDYGTFHLLMNMRILKELPRDSFLPRSNRNEKTMFFTSVRRKKEALLPPSDCLLYWNFLRLIGTSKYNFVIGALEKWFPGSGPHFIARGLAVTAQTSDLTSSELLVLFKMFQELTGYEEVVDMLRENEFVCDESMEKDEMNAVYEAGAGHVVAEKEQP